MSRETFQAQLTEVETGLVALLDKITTIQNEMVDQTRRVGENAHVMKGSDLMRIHVCRAVVERLIDAQQGLTKLIEFEDLLTEANENPTLEMILNHVSDIGIKATFTPEELAEYGITNLGPVSHDGG